MKIWIWLRLTHLPGKSSVQRSCRRIAVHRTTVSPSQFMHIVVRASMAAILPVVSKRMVIPVLKGTVKVVIFTAYTPFGDVRKAKLLH